MYCPECRVSFRDGFTECSDCHVPLVDSLPAEDAPEPDLDLVTVLEANSPVAVSLAKTLLDEAGIPYYVEGEELAVSIAAIDPHIYHWRHIQVGRDREAEARALLATIAEEDLVYNVDNETDAEIEEVPEGS